MGNLFGKDVGLDVRAFVDDHVGMVGGVVERGLVCLIVGTRVGVVEEVLGRIFEDSMEIGKVGILAGELAGVDVGVEVRDSAVT